MQTHVESTSIFKRIMALIHGRHLLLIDIILAIGSTVLALTAHASTESPKGVVETIVEQSKLLSDKSKFSAATKTIEDLVDFDKLTSAALSESMSQGSAKEVSTVKELLKKIITKTVYPEAPNFFKDVNIQFTDEQASHNQTHVTSTVTKNNKRSTVEYWVTNVGGKLKVVDLAIEGERWVENVKDQFQAVIERHGYAGLISRMQKRLKQIDEDRLRKKNKA